MMQRQPVAHATPLLLLLMIQCSTSAPESVQEVKWVTFTEGDFRAAALIMQAPEHLGEEGEQVGGVQVGSGHASGGAQEGGDQQRRLRGPLQLQRRAALRPRQEVRPPLLRRQGPVHL